jgi:diaminopimelate decarboxylase
MDMVYFHGNNKSSDELRLALKHHVGRIVVDNFDELKMVGKLAEEGGHITDILLRITPGVDPHTHEHVTTGVTGGKFGFPLFSAEQAVIQAMSTPSLNLVGLHFHIGSLIAEAHPYQEAIETVLDLANGMKNKHGFELEELNIGGGFSVQYTLDAPVPAISIFAEVIVSQIIRQCKQLGLAPPMLTLEPGRAVVAQAGVALYQAGVIKEIPGWRRYITVDGGMADNIRPALYGARYEAVVANRMLVEEEEVVTIAGKFCESGDILVRDITMAPALAGDVIAIPVCGAYCLPLASNYNASLKPAIVMVGEGKARLIRRRETFQDIIRYDLL